MLSRLFATIVVTAALAPSFGRGEVAGKWVAELTSPTLLHRFDHAPVGESSAR
jgi:hypothetical protein